MFVYQAANLCQSLKGQLDFMRYRDTSACFGFRIDCPLDDYAYLEVYPVPCQANNFTEP